MNNHLPDGLAVYLTGRRVGVLTPTEDGSYSFAYTPEVVSGHTGETLLSMSLPVRPEPFDGMASRPFFEGLLPEGTTREQIARGLRLGVGNSFGLLAALGRDCAGAAVILPSGRALGERTGSVKWLSEADLEKLVDELPRRPLGTGTVKTRLSLAGVQRKTGLIRAASGAWGLPTQDAPSTHLLKPQYPDSDFEDMVFNERFCMRVAECAGLGLARTELLRIGSHPALLVERFDRSTDGIATLRLHQEDLCQALGILPVFKYQGEHGPSAGQVCALLREQSVRGGADVLAFVRAVLVNLLLGNSDAHGKNLSLLYAEDGLRLAPFYDVVSVAVYGTEGSDIDTDMAMSIGTEFTPEAVTEADWSDFCHDCDISYTLLARERDALALRVPECARNVAALSKSEGWHRPVIDRIVSLCEARARLVRYTQE
jgi:serine/threonine-protein kinase HipA